MSGIFSQRFTTMLSQCRQFDLYLSGGKNSSPLPLRHTDTSSQETKLADQWFTDAHAEFENMSHESRLRFKLEGILDRMEYQKRFVEDVPLAKPELILLIDALKR